MSVGSFFGAVVGGIIGFVVTGGNPWGALYGASIGFGLGMAIDPMTPDMPSAGAPDQGTATMSGEVGTPIADLAGTAKVAGHLLCYGGERAEPIYGKTSGGGGKGGGPPEPEPQITGYRYYMSWAVGIIAGQADTLYAVYKNDEVVWEGELDCPASGGEETITLDGMGSAVLYFGTNDHALNSKVGALLDDADLNTPYRHLCWCFLDDCYIGEYNRAPTMKFIVKKIPENAFSTKHEIQTYDSNPAHVMWYILHDLIGLSESWLHSSDFATIASTLLSESRGLSVLFSSQQSALNYLESVNSHIDNILRYGTDGKFHPKLIRDDYVDGDLQLVDEDVMLEEPTFNRKSWIDTLNELKVQYSEIIDVERPKPFGPIYGTGWNSDGQLGINVAGVSQRKVFTAAENIDLFQEICCGNSYSVAIHNDGTIWATGYNGKGQFGDGTTNSTIVFVKIGLNKWTMVSAGVYTTMVLKNDGTLWGSGDNSTGQLGINNKIEQHSFIQETSGALWKFIDCRGGYNSFAIRQSDGILMGAGDETALSLRGWAPGFPSKILEFAQIKQSDGNYNHDAFKLATIGANSGFAIKSDGELLATGNNGFGTLGLGDSVHRYFFEQVGNARWTSVSSGGRSTVAIQEDGTLWSWGYNAYGQLGHGDKASRSSPTQIGTATWKKAVMCPSSCLLAIKSDDTLWGAGRNTGYELGLNHRTETLSLTQEVNSQSWRHVDGGISHSAALEL